MDRTPLSADIEDLTARLAAVTDNLPAAITEIDRDHRVVFANQTALAWIQLENIDDVLGRSVVDVVGNEAWELQRPYVEAALSGEVVTGQNDIVLPGGEQRVLEFTHVPRFDAVGTVIGYCTLSVDVTARKELEADLARTQRVEAIGQMTAGIAHDFNNLLSIILGNLELLAEQIDDPAQRDLIRPAIDATHKGADLTKNLLNFAMRAPLRPSALNLNDIVRDLEAWTSRTIPANVRVKTSLQADIPPVLADLAATEAALLNLMNNARDAMPHGGELTVSTWSESPAGDSRTIVVVAVSDTGVGIPDDIIADVFDPFVTTKGLGLGSGLGLSMVRGFMQQSGGDVELRSEVGVGTTVELIFAAADGPIAGTSGVTRESVRRPTTPARILVVMIRKRCSAR